MVLVKVVHGLEMELEILWGLMVLHKEERVGEVILLVVNTQVEILIGLWEMEDLEVEEEVEGRVEGCGESAVSESEGGSDCEVSGACSACTGTRARVISPRAPARLPD